MACNKQTFIDPPTINKTLALILFVVDIFFPGVGTIIVGFLACSCETLVVGILQLLTACLIVGWVWSILWGWELLAVSKKKVDIPGNTETGQDGLL